MRGSRFFSYAVVTALILVMLSVPRVPEVGAAGQPKTLRGTVPEVVARGQAHLVQHHSASDTIDIVVGLPLRDQQGLDQFLADVGNPSSPRYHQFLTQDQVNQLYEPTPAQEQQVVSWLKAHGLTVTDTFPNHLLVDAQGTFGQVESLLHVTMNDYQATVRGTQVTFYALDRDPTVDASVADVVESISNLDNYPRFHRVSNGTGDTSPPFYPQDFANAYDVNPMWNAGYNGSGQHIGITLWTVPPSDSSLNTFASTTGANVATVGNGRLKVIKVDGGTNYGDVGEAGLDIEYTSGLAPGATIDYYESATDSSGNPTAKSLEDALNRAGTDSNNNRQISNSWGECEASSTSDPFTAATQNIFQSNSATGHNYFFGSGDNGSWCDPNNVATDPYPFYPASSPYVTSVGGTKFNGNISSMWGWPGENTWDYCPYCNFSPQLFSPEGSGGGYSNLYGRPSWQTGSGLAPNGKRGYPDIASDADPNTGAYVCYSTNSTCTQVGGTSLSGPLWAGMLADVNQYLAAQGKSPAGFLDPTLYSLANNGQTYAPYHDVTSGTNGSYNAGLYWDAVTGWGSPDLCNLAHDLAATTGAPACFTAPNASYAPTGQPSTFTGGATVSYSVTVTNNGSVTWPAGGNNPVHLGIHFAAKGGGYSVNSSSWVTDQHFSLPSDVAPGQSVTVNVAVTAPITSGSYVLEYEMVQENVAWFAQYLDSNVSVPPALSATYAPSGQPSTFAAGSTTTYSVIVTNNGTSTWSAGGSTPVHLGIHFATKGGGYAANASSWVADQRFVLPNDVAPGQSATLIVTVTAPSATGSYVLEYEMVQEGVAWFAQYLDSTVSVAAPGGASYATNGQPSTFAAGGTATYSVTLTNNGSVTWPAGGSTPVHLGIHFATKGGGYAVNASSWVTDQRFSLPSDLAPGQSVTLNVAVTAPTTSGNYVLEYEVLQENVAWFAQYLDSNVSVPPALSATYTPSGQPSAFAAGSTASYSVTVTNNGTSIWPAGGSTPVHLGIHFATKGGGYTVNASSWVSDQRFVLPNDVAPGQSVTLNVAVTAPTTSGSYVLEYEMVQEGVAWFAQYLDSTVSAAAPGGASYATSGQPSTFTGGATVSYSVTVTNNGSVAWPAGGNNPVHLGVHFATKGGGYSVNASGWVTDQRYSLPSDLAPGQSVTLNVAVTAPTTSGSYVLEYEMVQEGVAWFAQYLDSNVSVPPALSAIYAPSGQPSAFAAGSTASYSVTVTNNGTSIWPAGGSTPVHLGIHFATKGGGYTVNASSWVSDQRFVLPNDVAPGQSVTLNVAVTAPTTSGSYVLEYEMVQENVAWFAQYLDNNVSVT